MGTRQRVAALFAAVLCAAPSAADERAFVTNQYAGTVSVIDLDEWEKIADLPTGEYPEGIASSADGASVYVANWFDNSLVRIDVASLRVIAEARTGDGPRAFGQFIARVPTR